MTDVAVLGTGTMGAPMARNLLRAGHRVRVWNRTPGRTGALRAEGATAAGSPAEAVVGAEVVITMLFDLAATREVVEQAADAPGEDTVWLQTGTIGPDGTAELAQFASTRGIALLDAPVLGTRKPAEDGTLVVLAGGRSRAAGSVEPSSTRSAARWSASTTPWTAPSRTST